jgi:polygalacturonase
MRTGRFWTNEIQISGIRIKATEGDTGEITGVTYTEITLSSISG